MNTQVEALFNSIKGEFEVYSITSGETLSTQKGMTFSQACTEMDGIGYGAGSSNGIDIRRVKEIAVEQTCNDIEKMDAAWMAANR